MNYTYTRFMGKTYRINQSEPYARRRFILGLIFAGIIGGAIGLIFSIMTPVPNADEMGCYEVGTPCWEALNGDEVQP